MRGVSWVLGLFHVRAWHGKWAPPLKLKPPTMSLTERKVFRFPSAGKLAGTITGAVLVIGALLALVVLALRRIRREPPAEVMIVEEREELASLRTAAGRFAGRLGRRLRSRVDGLFRREALTPAERVRRRYAELERRLSRAGRPRQPGVTVREYLAAAAAAAAIVGADAPPDAAPAAIAGIYELARYSAHVVDVSQAERFDSLALAFEV